MPDSEECCRGIGAPAGKELGSNCNGVFEELVTHSVGIGGKAGEYLERPGRLEEGHFAAIENGTAHLAGVPQEFGFLGNSRGEDN